MRWYPDRIPDWVSRFFPGYKFHGDRDRYEIFLTFDDGPTPGVTEFVLEQLDKFGFKATFFCIGKNVDENPQLFQKIIDAGHAVGNHTQNHLNGWKVGDEVYRENVTSAALSDHTSASLSDRIPDQIKDPIEEQRPSNRDLRNRLFRPPYGQIKRSQAKKLRQNGFQIIMWDVLSGDFDLSRSPESVLKNLKKNTRPGSIIVFHDSKKAAFTLRRVLPEYLRFLKKKGWQAISLVSDAEA